MGRLIATYREIAGGEEQFRVFYSRIEALKWMGLKESDIQPTTQVDDL
jgi:hypothetical protein